MSSGRELIAEAAYERKRDAAADRIFPFFREMVQTGKANPVVFNRDQVLLYLDALRSKRFMRNVENDGTLSYDLKVQVAHFNSGINKSWPAIRHFLFSSQVDEAAAIVMSVIESITRVMEACGFDYLPEQETEGDGGTDEHRTDDGEARDEPPRADPS